MFQFIAGDEIQKIERLTWWKWIAVDAISHESDGTFTFQLSIAEKLRIVTSFKCYCTLQLDNLGQNSQSFYYSFTSVQSWALSFLLFLPIDFDLEVVYLFRILPC